MKSKPNSLLRILSAGAMAVIVLVSVNAQQPSSSPEQSSAAQNQNSSNGNGDALGGYAVISSIEFGYRGLSHDGDHNKYRSDLNYSAGPRLFDASFLLKAKDGSGAEWYARSKLAGTRQLVALIRGNYSRPIPTPVHNLRPADETCGHCHWSEKFHGAQLKTFNHYAYDEQNTFRQIRMLISVGGGSPKTGVVAGIHWHMNIANEVTYISTDGQRQVIPWIRVKDQEGNVTEYIDRRRPLAPDQIANASKRRMDCVDCHNRPAHRYLPPDQAVNQSFASGRLDPSLPFLKREAVAVLSRQYNTSGEAVNEIASHLDQFYRTNYSSLYSNKNTAVKSATDEVQRIFQTYFFPEMKTDWQAHPDNIGHFYFTGCFRCHDGEHVSNTGKVIRNDCNICHTILADSANPTASVKTASFQHPVDLGALAERKCETCHKASEPFKHPVNLGDISPFQCVECHPRN